MPKNWNGPLGQVTLKDGRHETRAYADITSAAREIRRLRLEMIEHPLPPRIGDCWVGIFPNRHILIDDCGLIVPVWRIAREIEALGPRPLPSWSRRFASYDPDRDFRQAPVSGTGRSRGRRYGRYLRHMKTRQELRGNRGLEADLHDPEDFPVRVRLRAKRKDLPTLWDDVPHARRGDGWKNYRRAQHKA